MRTEAREFKAAVGGGLRANRGQWDFTVRLAGGAGTTGKNDLVTARLVEDTDDAVLGVPI